MRVLQLHERRLGTGSEGAQPPLTPSLAVGQEVGEVWSQWKRLRQCCRAATALSPQGWLLRQRTCQLSCAETCLPLVKQDRGGLLCQSLWRGHSTAQRDSCRPWVTLTTLHLHASHCADSRCLHLAVDTTLSPAATTSVVSSTLTTHYPIKQNKGESRRQGL